MIIFAFATAPALPAQSDLAEALRGCSTVEDNAARLACFDEVAKSKDAQQSQAAEAAPKRDTLVKKSAPQPLTDEVGKDVSSGDDRPREIYSATVTRCEHRHRLNEFFFILENGQVWKMSNFRRPIVGACEFEVTIEKDFFGFRMEIPSKGAAFRVSRVN